MGVLGSRPLFPWTQFIDKKLENIQIIVYGAKTTGPKSSTKSNLVQRLQEYRQFKDGEESAFSLEDNQIVFARDVFKGIDFIVVDTGQPLDDEKLPPLTNVFGIIFVADCADEKHQEDFDFRTERDALHALVKENRKLRGCPILLVAHNISLTTRGVPYRELMFRTFRHNMELNLLPQNQCRDECQCLTDEYEHCPAARHYLQCITSDHQADRFADEAEIKRYVNQIMQGVSRLIVSCLHGFDHIRRYQAPRQYI